MQPVQSSFQPGHIGLISGDLARFPLVYSSLLSLYVPKNTSWSIARGVGIADNRNEVVRSMNGDWLWFVDDDMCFGPRTLLSLLESGQDIVAALIPNRKPPFLPLAYHKQGEGYAPYSWGEMARLGLKKVDACTAGGLLIKKRVLDAIGDPWFEEGKLRPDKLSEDMHFCARAIELGFDVWIHCSVRIEHMTVCSIGSRPDGTGTYIRIEQEIVDLCKQSTRTTPQVMSE